jgi:pimeloyl-ACP methyl ester carboxylesterase
VENKAYKSEEGKARIIDCYESILKLWPVPCEYLNIGTRHGNTFVIASGEKSKEPLILLHGSSTNSAMWMGDVAKLAKNYRVYTVDIIGEPGKSDESRPKMLPQNYSDWMVDILDGLDIDSGTFICNSLGGWFSLCFAAASPQRVKKLVLIASSGIAPEKKSFLFKVIFLSMFGQKGINKINSLVYGKLKVPDKVIEFGNLVFKNFNPRMGKLYIFSDNELRKLTMPVMFIAGENDVLLPSEKTAQRLNCLLENVETKIIKGAGHVIIESIDDIITFLGN